MKYGNAGMGKKLCKSQLHVSCTVGHAEKYCSSFSRLLPAMKWIREIKRIKGNYVARLNYIAFKKKKVTEVKCCEVRKYLIRQLLASFDSCTVRFS